MKKTETIKKTIIYLWFAITVLMVFVTNRLVPFMMDDLWYSTVLADETPLRGIGDIFVAQVWHYNNWGGRSMTHTILQLTLLGGELFADILNTVVTVLLSWIIIFVAEDVAGKKIEKASNKVLALTLIVGALHGLNANWKMSMYWQSGSANYLYITVFILLFIRCYVRELSSEENKPLKGVAFYIIPLGILSGWSNENMGPTVFLITLVTIIYLKKNNKAVKPWMIMGSIASLAGSIACIIAPGNFVRSAEAAEEKGLLWRVYLRLYSECRGAFDYLFPSLIMVLILGAIYYGVKKEKVDLKTIVIFAAGVIACGAMILSPHFPDRATFGSMVLFIVAGLSIVIRILQTNYKKVYIILPGVVIWLHGIFYLAEFIGIAKGWIL